MIAPRIGAKVIVEPQYGWIGQIIFKNGKWSQVFGSEAKKKRFMKEDRRCHRSELRQKKNLVRADVKAIERAERYMSV